MRRRSSPFAIRFATEIAPLMPAVAVMAFATAGAVAQAAVDGASAVGALNAIEDVQVGERGKLFRVVVICREECPAGARASGVFFLRDVSATLNVDLKGKSRMAERLLFAPVEGGTEMTVRAARDIVASSTKRCAVEGEAAACIDIEFDAPAGEAATARAKGEAPLAAEHEPTILAAAQSRARQTGPAPRLREETGGERLIFASLAPPERFDAPSVKSPAAPSPAPEGAPDRAARGPDDGPRLIINREKAAALIGARVDVGGEAAEILARRFDGPTCAQAETRLKADAWALDAMVDLGFCRAAAGKLDEADGVFARLLDYTPDNYEALVGRALVAARRGRKDEAQRLFQSALNALPPIAESDRIVEAMARL